jgi:hypothetical protein
VLTDGTIVFWLKGFNTPSLPVAAGGHGTMNFPSMQYVSGITIARPDGTLTVTWQYTDDKGNSGSATATAKVTS